MTVLQCAVLVWSRTFRYADAKTVAAACAPIRGDADVMFPALLIAGAKIIVAIRVTSAYTLA